MKVQDLMNRIRLGELSLPEFQREYVWDREQARQLLISLYREYPTGSLLFWDTMTPPAIKNQSSGQQSSSPKQIILDGQQRLTALYLLTQNEPPPYYVVHDIKHDPRSLVFDLATGEIGDARPEQIAPTLIPITDCFRGELDTIAIAQQMIGSPGTHEVAQLLQTFLFNLSRLRNILERDYPYQIVPITATLDDAIDVFDRINSQGTKLSAAELALTHISSKWPAARQTMKQRITELSAQRFDVDLDFMVRALVGVINERARLDTIHSTPAEYLIAGWKRLTDALTVLLPLLAHHAAITTSADLASLDTLIPMLVHLGQHGGRFANQHTMRRAIRWLYLANIWMRYSSEAAQRLDYDLSIVRRADNPWAELENAIIEQRGRTSIGPSDLEGCDVGHPLYRIVRVMLKARGAVDWFTALPLTVAHTINAYQLFSDEMVNADDRVQRKHLDEVANQVFLSSAPLSPLISQLEAIEARRAGTLAEHCIPLNSNLWQPSQFTQFGSLGIPVTAPTSRGCGQPVDMAS